MGQMAKTITPRRVQYNDAKYTWELVLELMKQVNINLLETPGLKHTEKAISVKSSYQKSRLIMLII